MGYIVFIYIYIKYVSCIHIIDESLVYKKSEYYFGPKVFQKKKKIITMIIIIVEQPIAFSIR